MKRKGRHPEKALTPVKVRQEKRPGRYADGNGLYLVIDPSGARRWLLRTVVRGKRKDIGLGSVSLVPLKGYEDRATGKWIDGARDLAERLRRVARDDGDPIAERDKNKKIVPTFEQAARNIHAEHAAGWKNQKHAAQWINTLSEYVFPFIGGTRVDVLDSPDVLRVLAPIWLTKHETARRVRQRMGVVFDWAKAAGHRNGDNPTRGIEKGLPKKQKGEAEHHAALPYSQVPAFAHKLQDADIGELSRLAFEFLILSATRTNEVLLAKKSEIDGNVWTIPKERMKIKREHRVPLSPRAMQVLKKANELSGDSEYIFPGRAKGKPLSNMVFLMALRRMKVETTAHGFRSSFRDWAAEETDFPPMVCEMALAHAIGDKTEAAYRRGDLFEKRRKLMNKWAAFVGSKK